MNEQLQKAMATLLEKSIKAFESGADFMADQLPDVIQQLLMWHMVLGAAKALCAAGIVVAAIFALHMGAKWAKAAERHSDAWFIYLASSCFGVVVIGGLAANLWNLTWLQIWVAPKIFLIEYAAKMVAK